MQQGGTTGRTRAGAGPVLASLGGVAVLVSKFLEMGKVQVGSLGGVHVKGNSAILIAGVILVVIGLGMWIAKSRTADRLLGILAILAGAFGALVAGVMVGKEPIISTAATALGVSEAALKHAIAIGQAKVTVEAGAWLALAGSILVIAAGIANIVTARKAGARTSAQPPRPDMVTTP